MKKKNSSLIQEYIRASSAGFKDIPIRATSNKFRNAVLVEPRLELALETDFVIKNVMHFLGPEWGLYIFHGTANQEFIEQNYKQKGVHLINLNVPNLTAASHNALLASRDFWESIDSEKVLVFQTDSFLCRKGIEDFMEYDYVGAPWHASFAQNPLDFSGGNGGLSLRSKKAMLHCIDNYAYVPPQPEDIFFSHALYQADCYKVAPRSIAESFSIESVPHPNPLGLHRPDIWLEEEDITRVLNNISYENIQRNCTTQ